MSKKLVESIKQAAVERFRMRIDGIHGLSHWERVRENASYLAKHSGGDVLVAELFGYVHDCCRESDGADPAHGERAARFAESLHGEGGILSLSGDQLILLSYACEHHEKGRVSDDPTIGACWDADRLDLGRVGIHPSRKFLSTQRAKLESVIDWGYKRSTGRKARLKA